MSTQEYRPSHRSKQPSIIALFATVFGFILIAFFSILTLSTGDALWFWPVFAETPEQITVQCYGTPIAVAAHSAHFAEITAIFNENLSGYKNWDSLSMSDETYAAYQADPTMLVVFMHYAGPVRVHSLYKYFSNVDTLIVPLEGRHASSNPVFGLNSGIASAGALHIATTDPLSQYLNSTGLCSASLDAN
jgi:hypothetical protein